MDSTEKSVTLPVMNKMTNFTQNLNQKSSVMEEHFCHNLNINY